MNILLLNSGGLAAVMVLGHATIGRRQFFAIELSPGELEAS